jgi:hypothetical protein
MNNKKVIAKRMQQSENQKIAEVLSKFFLSSDLVRKFGVNQNSPKESLTLFLSPDGTHLQPSEEGLKILAKAKEAFPDLDFIETGILLFVVSRSWKTHKYNCGKVNMAEEELNHFLNVLTRKGYLERQSDNFSKSNKGDKASQSILDNFFDELEEIEKQKAEVENQ